MDYTAIGHTVGLAQRDGAARRARASAYLTEHTAALVEGYFALDDLGEFQVKGVEPSRCSVHELTGVGAAARAGSTSRARAASRGSSAATTRCGCSRPRCEQRAGGRAGR